MKVYLMKKNNDIPSENWYVTLVKSKRDAEKLINNGFFDYYEIVPVIDGENVDNFFNNEIGRG